MSPELSFGSELRNKEDAPVIVPGEGRKAVLIAVVTARCIQIGLEAPFASPCVMPTAPT